MSKDKTPPSDDTTSPAPKQSGPTSMDAAKVIRKMTGAGMESCIKRAAKMTPEDHKKLVAAYKSKDKPRDVLRSISDRLADGAKAKAEPKA